MRFWFFSLFRVERGSPIAGGGGGGPSSGIYFWFNFVRPSRIEFGELFRLFRPMAESF
jgi:hypothetical protein